MGPALGGKSGKKIAKEQGPPPIKRRKNSLKLLQNRVSNGGILVPCARVTYDACRMHRCRKAALKNPTTERGSASKSKTHLPATFFSLLKKRF